MTWLGTNSGKKIDLLKPDPAQIEIDDIAQALSFVPRFMGQTDTFYSVLTHSVNVASLVPPQFKLAALLHDATEAYIGDVPTPLKDLLGNSYRDVEARLAMAIGTRFGVRCFLHSLPDVIREADRIMLVTEHHLLQKKAADWGWDAEDIRLHKLPFESVTPVMFKEMVRRAQQMLG